MAAKIKQPTRREAYDAGWQDLLANGAGLPPAHYNTAARRHWHAGYDQCHFQLCVERAGPYTAMLWTSPED